MEETQNQEPVQETPKVEAPVQPEPQTRTVPLEVIEKMRAELQTAKQKAEQAEQKAQMYNEQISLYKANVQQPPPSKEPTSDLADFLEGRQDDALIEAGDVRKALKRYNEQQQKYIQSQIQAAVGGLTPKLAQIELSTSIPNYQQLIQEHLPALVREDPQVMEMIKESKNPLLTATKFAKMRADMMARQTPTQQTPPASVVDEINRIIENQSKPGAPGTGAGVNPGGISQANRIANMTAEEFRAYKDSILRG